jgi:flavin reductase (DIM6/NTAB) family NADH-FMN oxidoreductase RutF
VIQLNPENLTQKDVHKLLIGSVVPRPIAWVSTISADGVPNLAPFSYFTIASTQPPMLLFCPQRRVDGSIKDTQRNVEATGEFVLHIVNQALAEPMNQTSAEYPHGISEFEAAGLRTAPSTIVKPPRVAQSPIAFECRVEHDLHVGGAVGGNVVIGRVLLVHLQDEVYRDGYVVLSALQPVARLAGNDYTRVTDTFTLQRPVYKGGSGNGS